jgi:hypothetical protein
MTLLSNISGYCAKSESITDERLSQVLRQSRFETWHCQLPIEKKRLLSLVIGSSHWKSLDVLCSHPKFSELFHFHTGLCQRMLLYAPTAVESLLVKHPDLNLGMQMLLTLARSNSLDMKITWTVIRLCLKKQSINLATVVSAIGLMQRGPAIYKSCAEEAAAAKDEMKLFLAEFGKPLLLVIQNSVQDRSPEVNPLAECNSSGDELEPMVEVTDHHEAERTPAVEIGR